MLKIDPTHKEAREQMSLIEAYEASHPEAVRVVLLMYSPAVSQACSLAFAFGVVVLNVQADEMLSTLLTTSGVPGITG